MKGRKQFFGGAFVLIFALSFVIFGSARAEEMKHMHGKSADMDMHHMHIMMSHGLEMVTEGSNMVMLGEMKMAPSLDQLTLEHGRHMITGGKKLIEHSMSGHEMKSLHKAGHGDDPLMKYTHEMGHAMMEYANIIDNMNMEGDMSGDMMTMHHMHILINHAVDMAAEGSNMVMLGRMGMANGIDKESAEHGKMMLSDAGKLLTEVMEGKAMTEMHEKGIRMDNAMMAETHKMGAAAKKIIDLLSDMPK